MQSILRPYHKEGKRKGELYSMSSEYYLFLPATSTSSSVKVMLTKSYVKKNTLVTTIPASNLIPHFTGFDALTPPSLVIPVDDDDSYWLRDKIIKSTNNELLKFIC